MSQIEKVVVLGAGSWGTALSIVLDEKGHDCLIWSHREDQSIEINQKNTNQRYLPGLALPKTLHATSSLKEAALHGQIIVMAVPTKGIREVCQNILAHLTEPVLFVHVSKGIEPDSLKRISEMIKEEIKMRMDAGVFD